MKPAGSFVPKNQTLLQCYLHYNTLFREYQSQKQGISPLKSDFSRQKTPSCGKSLPFLAASPIGACQRQGKRVYCL